MSKYYRSQRTRNLFDPSSATPFRLSRSKIELFQECPFCFYLDRRIGVGRPPGFPFALNSAVDALLKKEFDLHRQTGTSHPLMQTAGVNAISFKHEKMDEWRDSLRAGIQYAIPGTNILFTGGVDDVWVKPSGELIIVDYKATSKATEVTLDADWQDGYKRQMEMYQWLFRRNDFQVDATGYFVYCNGKADVEQFNATLCFDIKLISYTGDDGWVENTVRAAHQCLVADKTPKPNEDCDYCRYRDAVSGALQG
ncbi:MAG: hypothetical protein EA369_04025 [Bradymonadales bacterium]|nr:MAG: hypothetical protein EA369_04025 [Bradymonadales bacterium]